MRLFASGALGVMALTLTTSVALADTAKCIASISKNTAAYEITVEKVLGKCRDGNAKDPTKVPSCPDSKSSAMISSAQSKFQAALTKDCAGETPTTVGFTGLVKRCNGGTRNGLFCTRDQNCEGQCGTGAEIGAPCTSDANCPNECSIGGVDAGIDCKGGGATQCANAGGVCNNPAFAGHCNAPAGGLCQAADRCPSVVDDSAPFADCDAPITDIASVATCLSCGAQSDAAAMSAFSWDARRPHAGDPAYGGPDPDKKSETAVLGCKRAIGKAVDKYFQGVRKATQKCTAGKLAGKVPSCPDSKLTDAISKAKSKLTDAINKKCGGTLYAETLRGSDVLAVDPLANTLALPNSAANFGDSASTLASSLVNCGDGFAVPSSIGGCASDCGNGQIDIGEDCDDGNRVNGDSCPADCHLHTACAVTGTKTVTVSVTAPASELPLGALVTYLAYDQNKVNLPGSGTGAASAVTANAFQVSVNDLDSAVRVVLVDPSDVGTPPYTVQFNVCSAASVSASDFSCLVESAGSATTSAASYGVTCSVSVM